MMMIIKIFLFLEFMFDDDDDHEAFVVLEIDVLMFFDL